MAATIRTLGDDERAWANAHYRAIAFHESPPDAIAVVAELAGERIGLGRLVEHAPGVVELGGIWTAEAARGQGIARAIVGELLARWSRRDRLWCIPFPHLDAFYRSCGFAPAPPPWPASIAAKVDACRIQYPGGVTVLALDP